MKQIYDAIIVGGGPAGLSAAIYMARAKFSVLVIEKEKIGGQITITSEIVNYPGVAKISGTELTEQMRQQAQAFGAEFLVANVKEVDLNGSIKRIVCDKGDYQSIGVILATGSSPRTLGFKGEKEFQGRGVAYCATCDGEFFSGLDVFVIGGGFAAAEEAMFLTKYARKVTIIVREEDFTCAKSIADEVKVYPNIEIFYNTEIIEAKGEGQLKEAYFKNNATGETWHYQARDNETFGIFVFAGYVPATTLFKDQILLNKSGNIITDKNQKTNLDGVYGAGDVCDKNLRQVVTAVSDGAVAATSLEKYIPAIVNELHVQTKEQAVKKTAETKVNTGGLGFINEETQQKLMPILSALTKKLIIKCEDDGSELAVKMQAFLEEFCQLSELLSYQVEKTTGYPSMKFYDEDNHYLNVNYHVVPGGHEFNSFVIAVYNAVGPKQALDETLLAQIKELSKKTNIKVIVSLSCTMCPEVVMATQRIALENPHIEAEVFDFAHFPEIKEKYQIMSVPAIILNDHDVYFGKKDIQQVYELLKAN